MQIINNKIGAREEKGDRKYNSLSDIESEIAEYFVAGHEKCEHTYLQVHRHEETHSPSRSRVHWKTRKKVDEWMWVKMKSLNE